MQSDPEDSSMQIGRAGSHLKDFLTAIVSSLTSSIINCSSGSTC